MTSAERKQKSRGKRTDFENQREREANAERIRKLRENKKKTGGQFKCSVCEPEQVFERREDLMRHTKDHYRPLPASQTAEEPKDEAVADPVEHSQDKRADFENQRKREAHTERKRRTRMKHKKSSSHSQNSEEHAEKVSDDAMKTSTPESQALASLSDMNVDDAPREMIKRASQRHMGNPEETISEEPKEKKSRKNDSVEDNAKSESTDRDVDQSIRKALR